MQLDEDQIRFIERLREAAKEHGVVADLLSCIAEAVYVDDMQGIVTIGDNECIQWLRAALLASQFVGYDGRGK